MPLSLSKTIAPLSQSRYELMACAHLYSEQIIRGNVEPASADAIRGREIHDALAQYVERLVAARERANVLTFAEIIDSGGYCDDAVAILDGLKQDFTIDPEQVLGTEVRLMLDDELQPTQHGTLPSCGPAFEGTLDLIHLSDAHTAEIIDYKSYWQIVDADTFQSLLYPFLLLKHYPQLDTVTFRLHFVRYGKASRSVTYTREQLPKMEARIRSERQRQIGLHMAAALPESELQATPGSHCAWCPLLRKCPLKDSNPWTQEPQDAARFLVWLDAAREQAIERLKAHVNIGGPITITDANGNCYEAGFHLKERSSYPLAECVPVIAAKEPELLQKLSVSGLSSYLKAKKRFALNEELARLKTATAYSEFGVRSVDKGEK